MILNRGPEFGQPVSLAQAKQGGDYFVDSVSGPEQQRLRLCELGIVAGAPVAILARANEGMTVVKVGGCRMALSRSMTEHIWVQRSGPR